MIIELSKRVLLLNIKLFALVYLLYIAAFSLILSYVQVPPSYFSDEYNAVNLYFMKHPMYYAVGLLVPFAFCTHYTLNNGVLARTLVPMGRILFNWWFTDVVRKWFRVFQYMFGWCGLPEYNNEPVQCVAHGGKWTGYEISGHILYTFLSLLIIYEEVSVFTKWQYLARAIDSGERAPLLHGGPKLPAYVSFPPKAWRILASAVRALFVVIAVTTIGFHFSVLNTIVNFHEVYHKITSATLAILIWLSTYRLVYPLYSSEDEFDLFELKRFGSVQQQ